MSLPQAARKFAVPRSRKPPTIPRVSFSMSISAPGGNRAQTSPTVLPGHRSAGELRNSAAPVKYPPPTTKKKSRLPHRGLKIPFITPLARRRLHALGFTLGEHDWMAGNLGRKLGSIDHTTLEACGERVSWSSGFELVCSYNWVRPRPGTPPQNPKARERWLQTPRGPRILVPGEAPRLVPHRLPLETRSRASGPNYRDTNTAMMPKWPFEPMFRAAEVMRPEFRFDEVDLVINRNSLSKLLKIVKGQCRQPFRLDLEMIKNTLIVNPLWQRIHDSCRNNYGRIFEQNFTRRSAQLELEGSTSHHRAIRYNLGPLRCVVLCEVDAAALGHRPSWALRNWTLGPTKPELVEQIDAVKKEMRPQAKDEMELFGSLARKRLPRHCYKPSSKVEKKGSGTLSSVTAELATQSRRSESGKKLSQMWLGRTPYLVLSLHKKNIFTDVRLEHCWPRLMRFEERSQESLQKLVTAIKMLRTFTANTMKRHSIAVCTKSVKTLRVFEPHDIPGTSLPSDIERRFWTKDVGQEPMRQAEEA